MREKGRRLTAVLAVILSCLAGRTAAAEPDFAGVAEILDARCVMCHSGEDAPLGLRLDSLEGLKAGSGNGPIAVAGKPGESELMRRASRA